MKSKDWIKRGFSIKMRNKFKLKRRRKLPDILLRAVYALGWRGFDSRREMNNSLVSLACIHSTLCEIQWALLIKIKNSFIIHLST